MTETRLQYILREKQAIGFLLNCANGIKAFDADGLPLGLWQNEQDAAKAVYREANVTTR